MNWQFTEAKNKFSELFTLARSEGCQRVARRDGTVVVLSEEEYQRLTGKKPSFAEYLMSTPWGEELDLERDKSSMRDIEL